MRYQHQAIRRRQEKMDMNRRRLGRARRGGLAGADRLWDWNGEAVVGLRTAEGEGEGRARGIRFVTAGGNSLRFWSGSVKAGYQRTKGGRSSRARDDGPR